MTNAREYVKHGLDAICDNVKACFPSGNILLPLITYAEVGNTQSAKWKDVIEYQVDVYAGHFEDVLDLTDKACDAMSELGFTRTYVSPDTTCRVDTGLYHKVLSFQATINTNEMNIISNF